MHDALDWAALPLVAWVLVAAHLSVANRNSMRSTCRAFREAANVELDHLQVRCHATTFPKDAFQMLHSFPKLRRLTLRCPAEHLSGSIELSASSFGPLVGTVEELDFRGVLPSDLSVFTRLRQLRFTCAQGWSVRGTSALASAAPSLTHLEQLGWEDMGDYAYLTRLTQLRVLNLRARAFDDARPLAALTALEDLDLLMSGVADLAPLARLCSLQRLTVPQSCHLATLSGLTALTALRYLSCTCRGGDVSQPTDVSFLSSFSLLQHLDLLYSWETSLRDVAAAAPFLTALTLAPDHPGPQDAPLDLSFLPLLTRLESFTLSGNANDASCGCIGQLPSLRSLLLSNTTAMTPAGILWFTSLTRLETLHLMQCNNVLVDVSHLGRLSSLTSLTLEAYGPWHHMQPTQPPPLDLLPLLQLRLRSLSLPFCDDAMLRTVARLRSLRRLRLHSGTFADASMLALAQLAGLEELFLSTTPVANAPLRVTNAGIMAPTALPFLRRYTVAGQQHRRQCDGPYVWN